MERVRPKKHLGQHFLKDEQTAIRIVNAMTIDDQAQVLEVGPGMGVLTKHLIEGPCSDRFLALDVDGESVDYLKRNYPFHNQKFLVSDFLKTNLDQYGDQVKVIGNFPYNISSQLFFKIWDQRHQVNEVVCMIQKEVADRIVSKEGNKVYGILSVLLQAFYDIEYLFTVPPHVFDPPPKVQSGVIRLVRNKVEKLDCDEKLFKQVVKAAFGKRRKTLRNALKDLHFQIDDTSADVFNQRAEQLSVEEFVGLTKMLNEFIE